MYTIYPITIFRNTRHHHPQPLRLKQVPAVIVLGFLEGVLDGRGVRFVGVGFVSRLDATTLRTLNPKPYTSQLQLSVTHVLLWSLAFNRP